MTPKSDNTGKSGTLPVPELNPLLNPILNKNLGRWAEAYFTNPPDKREEAVIHLLRELESEPAAPEKKPRPPLKGTEARKVTIPTKHNAVICRQCGFENEPVQKFCGDCGAQLGMVAATAMSSQHSEARQNTPTTGERHPPAKETFEVAPQLGSFLHLSDPPSRLAHAGKDRPIRYSSETLVAEVPESDRLKGGYRALIALVLVAIIGGLGYLAWRTGQFKAEGSMFPAQPPSATAQPASTPASVPRSPAPETRSSPPSAPVKKETHPLAPDSAAEEKLQNAAKKEFLPVPKPTASPAAAPAVSPNGSQELATALSFLNGAGQQRDSAAAAQWLWKAVEKKNTAATVLLAGLYLRGDGVQKNCDQGRVLLDAAADKGNKDAAGLLRNLQAFGCQ